MSTSSSVSGLVVIYGWRVPTEVEDSFRAVWSEITKAAREHGSLGSILTKTTENEWVAIALWRSETDRRRVFALLADTPEWPAVEKLDETALTVDTDLWQQSAFRT